MLAESWVLTTPRPGIRPQGATPQHLDRQREGCRFWGVPTGGTAYPEVTPTGHEDPILEKRSLRHGGGHKGRIWAVILHGRGSVSVRFREGGCGQRGSGGSPRGRDRDSKTETVRDGEYETQGQ